MASSELYKTEKLLETAEVAEQKGNVIVSLLELSKTTVYLAEFDL